MVHLRLTWLVLSDDYSDLKAVSPPNLARHLFQLFF
jgi:hypothetical protein